MRKPIVWKSLFFVFFCFFWFMRSVWPQIHHTETCLIEMTCSASRALEVRNRCLSQYSSTRNEAVELAELWRPDIDVFSIEFLLEMDRRASRALEARN